MTTTPTGATAPPEGATEYHLHRKVGLRPLTMISIGSIIGSGWLLGALNAAKTAGAARYAAAGSALFAIVLDVVAGTEVIGAHLSISPPKRFAASLPARLRVINQSFPCFIGC